MFHGGDGLTLRKLGRGVLVPFAQVNLDQPKQIARKGSNDRIEKRIKAAHSAASTSGRWLFQGMSPPLEGGK
jgi:hypothetical protein